MTIKAIARIRETADTNAKGAAAYAKAAFEKQGLTVRAKVVRPDVFTLGVKILNEWASIDFLLQGKKVIVDAVDLRIEELVPMTSWKAGQALRDARGINSTALARAFQKAADDLIDVAAAHTEVAKVLEKINKALDNLAAAVERNKQGRL